MASRLSWISRNLLWVDGVAGLLGACYSLSLHRLLSGFYRLPEPLLPAMGAANLVYACYSLSLASRKRRPLPFIVLLALANGTWACVCLYLLIRYSPEASGFGLAHLALEGLIVAALAYIEWRYRHALIERSGR